jgi:competence protein ComFC
MKIKQKLIDFFFPKYCLNCQTLGSFLCKNCQQKIKLTDTVCFLCKRKNQFGELCPLCLYYQGEEGRQWFVDNLIWTAYYKQKICKNLITSLKYKGVEEISDILAIMLDNKIKNIWKNIKAEIFYVPTSLITEKKRAYNQTKLIAQKLVAVNNNFTLNQGLILKKFRDKQTNKNIKKRWQNLNEFIYKGKTLKNKNIIIIDDIVTSGATLNQVAKCLKAYQVKSIKAAVVFKS